MTDAAQDAKAQTDADARLGREPSEVATKKTTVRKTDGPTDTYRERDNINGSRSAASTEPVYLPFNFILDDVSSGLNSREFRTTRGEVCMDLKLYVSLNEGAARGPFYVTLWTVRPGADSGSGAVAFPTDNVARSYCWAPTSNSTNYYFRFGYGSAGGANGVYSYVDGTGVARDR